MIGSFSSFVFFCFWCWYFSTFFSSREGKKEQRDEWVCFGCIVYLNLSFPPAFHALFDQQYPCFSQSQYLTMSFLGLAYSPTPIIFRNHLLSVWNAWIRFVPSMISKLRSRCAWWGFPSATPASLSGKILLHNARLWLKRGQPQGAKGGLNVIVLS